jgi:hypothetical protein
MYQYLLATGLNSELPLDLTGEEYHKVMEKIFKAEIHHVTDNAVSVKWPDGKEEHLNLNKDGYLHNVKNKISL